MPYLTYSEYRERSTFDPTEVDEFFARPDRVNTYARWEKGIRARKVDGPLRLRYAVPFGVGVVDGEPDDTLVPEIVKDWLTVYLDDRLHRARRYPGTEAPDDTDVTGDAKEATVEIKDAADQDKPAHAELPLRGSSGPSGALKGRPVSIGYNTIYGYFDAAARRRDEGGW